MMNMNQYQHFVVFLFWVSHAAHIWSNEILMLSMSQIWITINRTNVCLINENFFFSLKFTNVYCVIQYWDANIVYINYTNFVMWIKNYESTKNAKNFVWQKQFQNKLEKNTIYRVTYYIFSFSKHCFLIRFKSGNWYFQSAITNCKFQFFICKENSIRFDISFIFNWDSLSLNHFKKKSNND